MDHHEIQAMISPSWIVLKVRLFRCHKRSWLKYAKQSTKNYPEVKWSLPFSELIDLSWFLLVIWRCCFRLLFTIIYVSSSACLVKNVIPNSLSPPGTVPWQPARESYNQQGPPSPSSISSSGSTSPGYSPSRTLDLSGSSTSFSERKNAHHWQNGPVQEWTKEQVINEWMHFLLNLRIGSPSGNNIFSSRFANGCWL